MSGFDRERAAKLATELEKALRGTQLGGAEGLLSELRPLLDRIADGKLDEPEEHAPGLRLYAESELRSDAALSELYQDFCDVVRACDVERDAAIAFLQERADDRA